ncbi:MAG TPA: two-component regulator propeller domain-containing protein [Pyrinomonadaceae bacterium]
MGSARTTLSKPRPHALLSVTFAFCLFTVAFFCALAQKRDAEESPAQAATFHRWGAVTLFHGLPSDRVRAIAQDAEGHLWFGTDAGLARYDGRRTQTVTEAGLAAARVLALRADEEGALWVGTDDGAYLRTSAGEFKSIPETKGKRVAAIITPTRGRAVVATSDGLVFDCRRKDDGTYTAEPLAEQILPAQPPPGTSSSASTSSTRPPLELTSLAAAGETILVGTRGRGLLSVERGGAVREVVSRPRAFFFEALERDGAGRLHAGAQAPASESGIFRVDESDAAAAATADASSARAAKVAGEATGTVNALRFDARGDLYVGTDGRGVFHMREGRRIERFTFAGTAGALRSDRVYSVFIDREGVAWFGTDRGVCRYDPRGLRVENVAEELDGNFVRALYRTSSGRLLAGTNRGLYVREREGIAWRAVEEIGRRTVYSIAEDRRGRVLVASAGGLYASLAPDKSAAPGTIRFKPEEKKDEGGDEAEDGAKTKAEQAGAVAADGAVVAAAPTATPAQQSAEGQPEQKVAAAPERVEPEKPVSRPVAPPVVAGTIRAVAVLGGVTYIATWGRGVERLDEELRRTILWPRSEADNARGQEAISLHADEQAGRLWVGTTGGVFYLDAEGGVKTEPAHEPLGASTVYGVSSGPGGWLWLATNRGLYAQAPGGALVEAAPGRDARSVLAALPQTVAAVGGDAAAAAEASRPAPPQAWCATAGGGVIKVLLDEQFGPVTAALDAEQGLPSQNAFALLSSTLPREDGDEQTLVVGTSRGIALYGPGAAPPVIRPVQVVAARPLALEDLEGAGRDGERRGLYLAYPQNGLVLDVAANSSRTFPEQFQYAFLLTDDAGKTITRKLAHDAQFRVEGLRPGRYRITARAFTIDLVASAPFGFEFVVERAPFPWTITALSVLLALSLVALVWGYVQHRKIVRAGSDLLEANRQLAAARLQLANEAESERRRIARDLHDQTLADLRRLMLLADEMRPAGATEAPAPATTAPAAMATAEVSGGGAHAPDAPARTLAPALDPAVLRAEIESVSQEIRRICEDLSPSVLENVGFAAALEWALAERVAHMPPDCKFIYEFSCDEHLEERLHFAPGVQMQVYRIVQEAVSNVCRHAAARRVRLFVSATDEGVFHLTLEDDGRGFDTDRRKSRGERGLASIRARASMIDAEVRWQRRPDTEGGGTLFTLRKEPAAT